MASEWNRKTSRDGGKWASIFIRRKLSGFSHTGTMTEPICSLSMWFYWECQQKSCDFGDMGTEWCSQPRCIALWSRSGTCWWSRCSAPTLGWHIESLREPEASNTMFSMGNTWTIQVCRISACTHAGEVSSGLWARRAPLFPAVEKGFLDILFSPSLRPVSGTTGEKPLILTALYYTRDTWREVLAFDLNKL